MERSRYPRNWQHLSISICWTTSPVDIRQQCRYAFAPARSGGAAGPGLSTAVRGAVSSAGRALPSQGRGREFESPTVHRFLHSSRGRLAQLEERCLHTAEVTGSSPVSPTRKVKGLEAF